MITAAVTIKTDEELHKLLAIDDVIPNSIKIHDRVFCEIPELDLENDLTTMPSEDSKAKRGKKVKDKYKTFTIKDKKAYLLLGENMANPDKSASGGRDLKNNPITKDELSDWIEIYGVENLHIDYPREEVKKPVASKQKV